MNLNLMLKQVDRVVMRVLFPSELVEARTTACSFLMIYLSNNEGTKKKEMETCSGWGAAIMKTFKTILNNVEILQTIEGIDLSQYVSFLFIT